VCSPLSRVRAGGGGLTLLSRWASVMHQSHRRTASHLVTHLRDVHSSYYKTRCGMVYAQAKVLQ